GIRGCGEECKTRVQNQSHKSLFHELNSVEATHQNHRVILHRFSIPVGWLRPDLSVFGEGKRRKDTRGRQSPRDRAKNNRCREVVEQRRKTKNSDDTRTSTSPTIRQSLANKA